MRRRRCVQAVVRVRLRPGELAVAILLGRRHQEDRSQGQRLTRTGYALGLVNVARIHFAFVQGSVVERLRLQPYVSGGQNEGKGGQGGRVQSCDRGERYRPSHGTGARIVSVQENGLLITALLTFVAFIATGIGLHFLRSASRTTVTAVIAVAPINFRVRVQ